MHFNKALGHIHPLLAGAAASVMLVSLVGTAAIVGILPTSHGSNLPATTTPNAAAITAQAEPVMAAAPARDELETTSTTHRRNHTAYRPHSVQQHTTVVAQAPASMPVSQPRPAPVAQNSPVGIGVGAVVGGILGSQVGGGNGRTLATIAGAIGGGYVGNKIAQQGN